MLRRLLRGAPVDGQTGLRDLIERVRIVCTVYDPETGTYRYDYGLILEIAGGVTFLLAVGAFFVGEARAGSRRLPGPRPVRRRDGRRAAAAMGECVAVVALIIPGGDLLGRGRPDTVVAEDVL